MKKLLIVIAFFICWIILAQSCMKMRISDSEAKKQFAAAGVTLHTETLDVNGFKLHYVQTGNDTFPTLFFVHGSPGSWDAFSVYLKDSDLLKKYRMVSIDRPGFGYSEFGNARNLSDQSAIISPIFKHIQNGKPIYIIGHSLGGPMIVKLVADNPFTFSGMVILAGSVDPAEEAPEKWRGFLKNSGLQYLLPGAFRPSNNEIWYLKKDLPPLSKQFASITCNVWIIHGNKDKFVPVGNAAYAKKMLVNAKSVDVTILDGAPHFIPWAPWYIDVKKVLLQLHGTMSPNGMLPE
ncbi:MAG TPA: alpha/beta hydrolase [Ferruginibacter sp.]|nr:alpha/beta hydrolase [Ferruginibacter sp.]